MTDNTQKFMKQLLDSLKELDYIKPEDLPNIDLYMDQVTTFMEEQLSDSKRHEEDKVLTKTMINNYAKNKLLPPPDKKRYTKEHLLMLIFIYYFKNILSISDIQTLLSPITERYFRSGSEQNMEYVYREVFTGIMSQSEYLSKDLVRRFQYARSTFSDAPAQDQDFLRQFAFICLLSFDVYMKKSLIEKMIDDMVPQEEGKEKKEKKTKK